MMCMEGESIYWTCVYKNSVSTTREICNKVSTSINITPFDAGGVSQAKVKPPSCDHGITKKLAKPKTWCQHHQQYRQTG